MSTYLSVPCNFLWSFWEPCAELIRKPFEFPHCNILALLHIYLFLPCSRTAQQVSPSSSCSRLDVKYYKANCRSSLSKLQILHFILLRLPLTNLPVWQFDNFFTVPEVFLLCRQQHCSKCCLKKKNHAFILKGNFNAASSPGKVAVSASGRASWTC